MRQPVTRVMAASALAAVLGGAVQSTNVMAQAQEGMSIVEQGKQAARDRKRGNCLACHAMADGTLPGNIGPPLVAMKARFPDKAVLRTQIWDATKKNPNSMMPPFGRHGILTEEEIDNIVEYVYTL